MHDRTQKSRRVDQPQPGFFMVRLTKGGVFVPARIYQPCPIEFCIYSPFQAIDRPRALVAEADGQPAEVLTVWLFGHPIPWEKYELMAHKAWQKRERDPDHPLANPRKKIDLGKMKPLY